jgi:hypothetical protein
MWEKYLLVSLAVTCIANTISREKIFAPLRDRLGGKDTWAGYLISCPYCLSHWLAFLFVPLFKVRLLTVPHAWGLATSLLEWFFNSILVVMLSAFIRMVFFSIDDLVGVFRRYEKIEDEEIEERERLKNAPLEQLQKDRAARDNRFH